MMEQVSYRDWRFEVDVARTKSVYASLRQGAAATCGCIPCKNFIANRALAYPTAMKDLLTALGISYEKEAEVYHICRQEDGKHLYGSWFHFKGTFLEGQESIVKNPNGGGNLQLHSISDTFSLGFLKEASLCYFEEAEYKDLIQVECMMQLDWVLDKALEVE